jgi:hypothetical protein
MSACERTTVAAAVVDIGLLFLFPPFMSVDAASGGRAHVALGHHPVWKPPSAEAAFRALYPEVGDAPHPVRLADVTPRINRVRLSASAIGVAIVYVLVIEGRRRLARSPSERPSEGLGPVKGGMSRP